MTAVTTTTPEFIAWFDAVQEKLIKHYEKNCKSMVEGFKLEHIEGSRYIKIATTTLEQRSVFCFIDKNNGDILKAESWSKPAKHARGNLFDEDKGLKYVTTYGMAYLR